MRSTYFWLFHIITGALLAVFLGIHLVIIHLDDILNFLGFGTGEATSWESMINRADKGLWVGLYSVLLVVVLYHGFYGLRGVILELMPSANAGRIVTWIVTVVGIGFLALGIYAPVYLFSN